MRSLALSLALLAALGGCSSARLSSPGRSWNADAGAVFHLDSNNVRPGAQPGWTSADAAGLPIFPGLARYEEAALGPGGIRRAALHGAANAPRLCAARDALGVIRHQHKPAADGHAGAPEVELCDPAGLQRRDPRAADRDAKLRMIVADNGSDWYVSGAPDARWNNDALVGELRQVRGSAFEVVRMDGLVAGA